MCTVLYSFLFGILLSPVEMGCGWLEIGNVSFGHVSNSPSPNYAHRQSTTAADDVFCLCCVSCTVTAL